MSWLPLDKLNEAENKLVDRLNSRIKNLHGQHQTYLKKLKTTHKEWKTKFDKENKKYLQKCQEYHEGKIDKIDLDTNALQVYTVYKTQIDIYDEKVSSELQSHKEKLENFEKEIESIYKEIQQNIQEDKILEETWKQMIAKLADEVERIKFDIIQVDKRIAKEDQIIDYPKL